MHENVLLIVNFFCSSVHCSLLAEDAIKSAIKDYQSKRAQRLAATNVTLAASSSQPQQATA